ncbi:salicylate synthase [Streptomyces sp. MUSC 14]|uniref:salicylate synthase n=1 Tax=Streptomyces sp. MUSC 14 TaxID=1354889 RepID=UPI0008F5BC3B|nr:salicylate synthase [Streptomyces sp. MUSC 14]OIJ90614.1 salicylate synthase [Streptomyces sp. MUSC 14]
MRSYAEISYGTEKLGSRSLLSAVMRLARAGLFEDYVVYERNGVWAFAGGALTTVTLDAENVRTVTGAGESATPWTGSSSAALGAALEASAPVANWTAYGYLMFEFAALLPALATRGAVPVEGELARMIVPRVEVLIDERGVVSRAWDAADNERIREILEDVAEPPRPVVSAVDIRTDEGGYRERVAQAVKEIRLGQYQKVILSRTVDVPFELDFAATYELGRESNNPARSFLLRLGSWESAGFSPEVVLTVDETGQVMTQPLAGTRAFGRGAGNDAEARRVLESDPKEIYEHAVSVRTSQEELRRVCRPGTVAVRDFMDIKERGSVQHLASLVSGTLGATHTPWDALEAVFPAVTASGVPKRESLDAIVRLDETRRGLYSGAVLTFTHDGALDAALVLRAMYGQEGRAWLRAGAGIVTDSMPDREFEETCEKLSSVAPYLVRSQG